MRRVVFWLILFIASIVLFTYMMVTHGGDTLCDWIPDAHGCSTSQH